MTIRGYSFKEKVQSPTLPQKNDLQQPQWSSNGHIISKQQQQQQQHTSRMLPVVGTCDHKYCSPILLGSLLGVVILVLLCYSCYSRIMDGSSYSIGSGTKKQHLGFRSNAVGLGLDDGGDRFQEELQRCKRNHQSEWNKWKSKNNNEYNNKDDGGQIPDEDDDNNPSSGNYNVQYMDNLRLRKGKIRLVFTREHDRYRISGVSSYENCEGEAHNIVEGFVLLDGKEGWWREESEHGMELINYGTFDFKRNRFRGNWRENTGISGSFIEFIKDLS